MTIEPPLPDSRIAGMTARQVFHVPVRVPPIIRSHSASDASQVLFGQPAIPAFATARCRPPKVSTPVATARRRLAATPTAQSAGRCGEIRKFGVGGNCATTGSYDACDGLGEGRSVGGLVLKARQRRAEV